LEIALKLSKTNDINLASEEIERLKEAADAFPFTLGSYPQPPNTRHWFRRDGFQLGFTRDILPYAELYHLSASFYHRSCTDDEMQMLNDIFFEGKAIEKPAISNKQVRHLWRKVDE